MGFLKKNENRDSEKKLSRKDIVIVVLSVLSLVLLLAIILISKNRDKQVAEYLQQNKDYTTDDAAAALNRGLESYIEISEVSSEKWIEIYNSGNESIDVSGIEFFQEQKKIAAIEDNTIIKKEQYLAVDVSNNPCAEDINIISIKNKDGVLIKSIMVPKTLAGKSYGQLIDDNNTWGYMTATKGKANSDSDIEYAKYNGIGFSTPGGFYDGSFMLSLTCDEGEKIFYTTDGTLPTTASEEYTGAIKITNQSGSKYKYAALAMGYKKGEDYFPDSLDMGMVLRAIAVNSAGETTKEAIQSYYIGLRQDSDYSNISVMSITTDPDNLFDYESGIYVGGRYAEDAIIQELGPGHGNYYNNWKKPARIEFYEPTKDKTFEMDSNISIIVDDATTDIQKDISIAFDTEKVSEYEGASIKDYISDVGVINLVQGGADNDLKVRSYALSKLADSLSIATYNYTPCALFIDGEYWGLYFIKQDYDAKFIKQRYGLKDQEIVVRKYMDYDADYALLTDYVRNNNMAVDANYETLKTMMDVDNYAEFVCFNMYVGNYPFSPRNSAAWKTASSDGTGYADGRWRFMCESLQNTLCISKFQNTSIDSFKQVGMQSDVFLQSLLMNNDFCNLLVTKMKALSTTCFNDENVESVFENAVSLIRKPAIASKTRFYGKDTEASYNFAVEYITDFLEGRKDYILKYTEEMADRGGDISAALEFERIEAEKEESEDSTLEDVSGENPENEETNEETLEPQTEQTDESAGVENNG